MKVAIVKGVRDLEASYVRACKELNISFDIIDVFADDLWVEKIRGGGYERVFIRPPCDSVENRSFYSDISELIEDVAPGLLYPSLSSLRYYENKRALYYKLIGTSCRYPRTALVHRREDFASKCETLGYPVVMKSVVGSGSAGVKIIRNKSQAKSVSRRIFGLHPSVALGVIPFVKYAGLPIPAVGRTIKHACLLQEFIYFKWEWRIIIIGETVSAFRKLKGDDGFASGSELYGFGLPPVHLLKQAMADSKRLDFSSGALDYFECADGTYVLNEAQSLFGCRPKSHEYPDATMFDDSGQPCIYRVDGDQFNLVYGSFCHNECSSLRVKHALNMPLL